MGTDGRKMSKLFKNYPDPKMVLQKYGGDAMRLYLMGSVIMVGENINLDEKEFDNQVKNVLLPFWNSFKYFLTYANLFDFSPKEVQQSSPNILDQWIQNQTSNFIDNLEKNLEKYDLPTATRLIEPFVNDLSRWYIRQSRDRFVNGDVNALQTLWQVLVQFSLAVAPIIPFITEYIWQTLVVGIVPQATESIHLSFYPHHDNFDQKLADNMALVQQICEQGNMIRKTQQISTRQPLAKLTIASNQKINLSNELLEIIKTEINVKNIEIISSKDNLVVTLDTNITPKLKAEGDARDLIRSIQSLRKEANLDLKDKINIFAPSWPENFEDEIKSKTLAESISKSDQLKIEKIS
jgi:isoleucyl-tRNA synthetase